MTPLNPRHARLLAQTAFEEAAELARDGHIAESIERAHAGVDTLLSYPAEQWPRTIDGRLSWACCVSEIGPACQHRAAQAHANRKAFNRP